VQTLGRPLPRLEVRIADIGTGATQPIGVSGEICVRGYQNMHGYCGPPELTASAIDKDGWLHMGDLGAMDSRGYLRITGRLKDMVIRGGMNIYPREIERSSSRIRRSRTQASWESRTRNGARLSRR